MSRNTIINEETLSINENTGWLTLNKKSSIVITKIKVAASLPTFINKIKIFVNS